MTFHRLFRCAECKKRWLVSYSAMELVLNFWTVMRAMADVEIDVANHAADEVNAKVEVYLAESCR